MASADPSTTTRQSKRFLYLYALAVCGGSVAYVPFLTILLPVQVSALAGDAALTLLAQLAFAGAIMASLANIGFGWLSDRTGSRRGWIAAGMILSSLLLPAMYFANTAAMFFGLILCWQLALNMMLAPMTAWAGDTVPDGQKGLLGGLLAFAPAVAALAGVLVTLPGLAGNFERLLLIAMLVMAMVAPVLLVGRPASFAQLLPDPEPDRAPLENLPAKAVRGAVVRMWLARMSIQIAEASLFAFLLLWFRSLRPGFPENWVAMIFAVILCAAVVPTLAAGRWSDRFDRPILPLGASAAMIATGLFLMAAADSLPAAIAGYVVFGLFSSVFLALHTSQTLRVLPAARNRGRDLGLFNLTNTVPSLIMPWPTLVLVPAYGFDALFVLLGMLALLAVALLLTMPRPENQAGRRA